MSTKGKVDGSSKCHPQDLDDNDIHTGVESGKPDSLSSSLHKDDSTSIVHPKHDSHGHGEGEHRKYDGTIPFMPLYTMVFQRQRWGEKQHRPHGEFSATFYDLFYIAAAYNLGNLIKNDPSWTGLFYFAAIFWPLQKTWMEKLYFDCRFGYRAPDVFHQTLEHITWIILATAVMHIRTVTVLANPKYEIDMFLFCLSITILSAMSMAKYFEIIICQKFVCAKQPDNERKNLYPEAFYSAFREVLLLLVPFTFYLAATIYCATKYYRATNYDTSSSNYGHRSLAEQASQSSNEGLKQDHIAPLLLLVGIIINRFHQWYLFLHYIPTLPNRKDFAVPLNIDVVIHRHGEWVMLMLGESVLSLLIVDMKEEWSYISSFVCGILSVIFLQYLHFRSQPHNPDEHALRRHIRAGTAFVLLMEFYCAFLLILGTCYKMFLYEHIYAAYDKADGYNSKSNRFLFSLGTGDEVHYGGWGSVTYPSNRFLAGGSDDGAKRFSTGDRQQRIAHLFSASLALMLLCIDLMTLVHEGVKSRLERQCGRNPTLKLFGLFVGFVRLASMAFVGTVSQYITDPNVLPAIGLAVIVAQVVLSAVGTFVFYYSSNDEIIACMGESDKNSDDLKHIDTKQDAFNNESEM